MYQHTDNDRRCFGKGYDGVTCENRVAVRQYGRWQKNRSASYLTSLLLLALVAQPLLAQEKQAGPLRDIHAKILSMSPDQQQAPANPAKRSLTVEDAVSIFLQQNLQLVAARYDIDLADAEKLTARLRPNPQFAFSSADLPLGFSGPVLKEQTYNYGISETFELGGKRSKRIAEANANSDLARAGFQIVLWQLTNDVKKKFYAVLLAESLLNLARENQKTFAEIIKHTTEVFQLGEISGLD